MYSEPSLQYTFVHKNVIKMNFQLWRIHNEESYMYEMSCFILSTLNIRFGYLLESPNDGIIFFETSEKNLENYD